MSTGVLLITLSAGCSSGSKPTPAPASPGSPTVVAAQPNTTAPTVQPTVGFGPVVTLTSKEGYVYKVQAEPYTGPAITALDANGGTYDAPPGQVFAAVAVAVSDGLADRAEPLDPQFVSQPGLVLSVPADSAAKFGIAAKDCDHNGEHSSAWCDLLMPVPSQGTGQPGHIATVQISNGQLEPGQTVSFMLAWQLPVSQAAPMGKLTLFAQLGAFGNLVQVPVSAAR